MDECKYCTEEDYWEPAFEETGHFFDRTITLDEYVNYDGSITVGIDVEGYQITAKTFPINYCPMCGRKLKEV